jgi:hypothetical protein
MYVQSLYTVLSVVVGLKYTHAYMYMFVKVRLYIYITSCYRFLVYHISGDVEQCSAGSTISK